MLPRDGYFACEASRLPAGRSIAEVGCQFGRFGGGVIFFLHFNDYAIYNFTFKLNLWG